MRSCGRRLQPGVRKIGWCIEIDHHARVLNIYIKYAPGISIDNDTRTLVLGRCHQLREDRVVENHWMAAASVKTSNNYWLPGLAVSIDQGAKRGRSDQGMIGEVDDSRIGAAAEGLGEADLERRQLATRIIRIIDDCDFRSVFNGGTDAIGVRAEHDYDTARNVQRERHRAGDKALIANSKQWFRIPHAARFAGCKQNRGNSRSAQIGSEEGSSGLAAQPADLRAEREIIADAGTPLANYFRHYRDCDLLRRLGADIESERRVNFVDQTRVDTILG
jgi:hypothetical protein